jgi:hypothetical protein
MTVGYGVGAGVGLGTEVTPGTGVAPTTWHPFTQESVQAKRDLVEDGTIYGDRSILSRLYGLRSGSGGFTTVVDGSSFVRPLYYWNGNASGASTSAAISGLITAAPTATPAAGGTHVPGTYLFAVASVWERNTDGQLFYMPASAEDSVVLGSGDLTADLGWASPSGLNPPDGFTHVGTLIFRSEPDGVAATMRAVHYVEGTANSWSDSDPAAKPRIASLSPYSASIRMHTFVKSFTPGTDPLPAFSTTVVKDNDFSDRFLLCKMNQFTLTMGGGNNPVTAQFDMMCRDWERVANPSITHSVLNKMMGWQSQIAVDGEYSEIPEGFTIVGTNNCEMVPGTSGKARYRDVGYGQRAITGTLTRGFEDHKFFDLMRQGCRFNLRTYCHGGHVDNTACVVPNALIEAYPFQYCMITDVYQCSIGQAGGNVGGPGRITEGINFSAQTDPSEGTELKIRVFNLTAGPYQ